MSKQRSSLVLPIGYAEQVMELEMKLEDEESVQAIQILSKMYRIGVDYYLQNDLKKATYLQKKLNNLVLRSFQTKQNDCQQQARKRVFKQLKEETQKINICEQTYINSWVKQSQKSQKKIKDCLLADLNRQQQRFQSRMLQRIKSAGKL